MPMTETQKRECRLLIHSHAAAAAAGNAVPVPGLGVAIDTVAMSTLAMSLATVFGGQIDKAVASNMALLAVRRSILRQPIKTLTKEFSKLLPGLGQLVAPTISFGMLEIAGWHLANQLAAEQYMHIRT